MVTFRTLPCCLVATFFSQVQVDFESQTPEADDYHGIKIVLGQAFPKVSLDLGGIADEIIKRSSISQCLKVSFTSQNLGLRIRM